MLITKAIAKENLGDYICLSITKKKIFICNRFRADGALSTSISVNSFQNDITVTLHNVHKINLSAVIARSPSNYSYIT